MISEVFEKKSSQPILIFIYNITQSYLLLKYNFKELRQYQVENDI